MDEGTRDAVLTHMEAQGASKAVGFIGPFDAVLRSGATPAMSAAVDELIVSAAKRGTTNCVLIEIIIFRYAPSRTAYAPQSTSVHIQMSSNHWSSLQVRLKGLPCSCSL